MGQHGPEGPRLLLLSRWLATPKRSSRPSPTWFAPGEPSSSWGLLAGSSFFRLVVFFEGAFGRRRRGPSALRR